MKLFRQIRQIFNYKTIIVIILSVISTLLCKYFKIDTEFPMTIVGIAVVFPIVFSIDGAYKRRESALQHYGSFKTHGRSIYLASRDWATDVTKENLDILKKILKDIFKSSKVLFNAKRELQEQKENEVYIHFSELSKHIKGLRDKGIASGEISRCNQYLSKMLDAFENMKHIFQYRTPRTLRTYSKIFIYSIPIIYGPFFVNIAGNYNTAILLVMPVLLSVVLTSLDNIQEQLENPFDEIGEDDVRINPDKFVERLDY
jgi:predicted membrane chloride channel (bestrophin family)